MDLDEIDLAILDLYAYADEWGVAPREFRRLLAERIAIAAEIADCDELPTIH